jgi:hypothetical protein
MAERGREGGPASPERMAERGREGGPAPLERMAESRREGGPASPERGREGGNAKSTFDVLLVIGRNRQSVRNPL